MCQIRINIISLIISTSLLAQTNKDINEIIKVDEKLGSEYYKIVQENNHFILIDSLNQKIIAEKSDTLYFSIPFFIAKKKNHVNFFNYKGFNLKIKNIRDYKIDENNFRLIALQKNEIKLFDFDGNETNTYPSCFYHCDWCGTLAGKGYYVTNADEKKITYKISDASGNSDSYIYTLNGLPQNSINELVKINNISYLIISSNNKKGLYSFENFPEYYENYDIDYSYYEEKQTTIDTKEILPIKFDDIKPFNGVVFLKSKSLTAIFPHSSNLKYKNIGEYKYGYLRFTDITNKSGWINLETGKEYYDQ